MLETFGRMFLALGPPVILLVGTGATVAIAVAIPGPTRWWALGAGPALSLIFAYAGVLLVVRIIAPAEGSGFLLGGAAMGLYLATATVYYPVLAVVGIWRLWTSRGPKA